MDKEDYSKMLVLIYQATWHRCVNSAYFLLVIVHTKCHLGIDVNSSSAVRKVESVRNKLKNNKTHNVRITQQRGAFANHCCSGKEINITYLCVCVCVCVCSCACAGASASAPVCAYSLTYAACKSNAPYCDVICSHICSQICHIIW
jgi:hypothetical protein